MESEDESSLQGDESRDEEEYGGGDDELEYQITFPPPSVSKIDSDFVMIKSSVDDGENGDGPSNPQSSSDDEGISNNDEGEAGTDAQQQEERQNPTEQQPLVFILGYVQTPDTQLTDCGKIYEENGCITVRYSPPKEYILFNREKLRPIGEKLVDLIDELSLRQNPILFHVFSNSGATIYQHMMQSIESDAELLANVRGCTFDSCPYKMTHFNFINACKQIMFLSTPHQRRLQFSNVMATFISLILLCYLILRQCMVMAWQMLQTLMFNRNDALVIMKNIATETEKDCFEYLMDTKPMKNGKSKMDYMFIYSKSDWVTPWTDVKEVIDEINSGREEDENSTENTKIIELQFERSQHCKHIDAYRETYASNVRSMIFSCLLQR